MKKIILSVIITVTGLGLYAQSPIGKWRAYDWYTQSGTGQKTDLLKGYWKDPACYKEVVFHLTADGKMSAEAGKCKDAKDAIHAFVGWKLEGRNKIILFPDDSDMDPQTYQLEFIGDKMRWTMTFPDDPEINDAKEVRRFVMEYIKG